MNNKNKFSLLLVITLLVTGLLSSCFRDDLTDCPRPFQVTIKALDADQNDITESGEVKNAILFVFDQNNELVKGFTINEAQIKGRQPLNIEINYPGYESLYFVAWGNVDESLEYSRIESVHNLLDLYVKLKSQGGFAVSPGDFFRGNLIVPVEYGGLESGKSHVVEINRMTSGVTISALHLKEWNNNLEGEYSFVVHESMNTYDQDGLLRGSLVDYSPTCSFTVTGDLWAPIFYTFPCEGGKGFHVDILYNGKIIYTIDHDSEGHLFVPIVGRTLNIIIDFRANLSVVCEVTPWNVVYQYVNY